MLRKLSRIKRHHSTKRTQGSGLMITMQPKTEWTRGGILAQTQTQLNSESEVKPGLVFPP